MLEVVLILCILLHLNASNNCVGCIFFHVLFSDGSSYIIGIYCSCMNK